MRLVTVVCLGIATSSIALSQASVNSTPATMPKKAALVLREKPRVDTKDAKGQPEFATYEDFIEALAGWKTQQILASLAHSPTLTIDTQTPEIEALKKRLVDLETKLSFDEYLLSSKQPKQVEVTLDPARLNLYQRLDADPLQFLVSLKSVSPYLNGYKAVINVGNPSTARFRGIKVTCKWSKPFDWNTYSEETFKRWNSAIHSSETEVQNDIAPGSWNPVEVILLPATQDELGYLSVSIDANTISMSSN